MSTPRRLYPVDADTTPLTLEQAEFMVAVQSRMDGLDQVRQEIADGLVTGPEITRTAVYRLLALTLLMLNEKPPR